MGDVSSSNAHIIWKGAIKVVVLGMDYGLYDRMYVFNRDKEVSAPHPPKITGTEVQPMAIYCQSRSMFIIT